MKAERAAAVGLIRLELAEGFQRRRAVGRPLVGVEGQQAQQEGFDGQGNLGPPQAWALRLAVKLKGELQLFRLGDERVRAEEQLVQNDAQGIDVAAGGGRKAAELLGRVI